MAKAIRWTAYAIAGIVATFLAFAAAGHWFGLAVAVAFIFGPKVWKNL